MFIILACFYIFFSSFHFISVNKQKIGLSLNWSQCKRTVNHRETGTDPSSGVQLNYRWWRKAFRKVCSFCWSVCPYLKRLNTDLLKNKLISNSSQWPIKTRLHGNVERGVLIRKQMGYRHLGLNGSMKILGYKSQMHYRILTFLIQHKFF